MRRRRPYTRADRIGGLMHEEVERIVQYELRDPLARHVHVTGARLSGDLGHLKVTWVLRDGGQSERAEQVLEKAAPYIGRVLRDTYQMRKTPKVVFHFDAEHARLCRVRELLDATSLDTDTMHGEREEAVGGSEPDEYDSSAP